MIDIKNRLSGTTAGVGQNLTGIGTTGVLSTNWRSQPNAAARIGDGSPVYCNFNATTSFNSATENATVELQVVAVPMTSYITFTTTGDTDIAATVITKTNHQLQVGDRLSVSSSGALGSPLAAATFYYVVSVPTADTFTIATTPGGTAISITDQASVTYTWTSTTFFTTGDTDIAATVITETGHGLPNGTRLTMASSGSIGSGLAANTSFYVVNATTDTFGVSLTPDGAAISITDQASVTYTWTWHPEVLVSSGPIGVDRLQAGKFRHSLVIPPMQASPRYPANTNLMARYVPSATLTAGAILADLGPHPQSSTRSLTESAY